MTNNADPDHLASEEAKWSGSTMFARAGYIRVPQDQVNYLRSKGPLFFQLNKFSPSQSLVVTDNSISVTDKIVNHVTNRN